VLCDLLCHPISTTPLPLSQLHRVSRMYRLGASIFLVQGRICFSDSTTHIHILIPQIWHQHHQHISSSLPPLFVLAPPNFHVLFFISHCSHACCLQLLLSVCVLAGSSTIYMFGECLLPSGLHAKGSGFIPRQPILFAFRFNRFVFIRIHKCDSFQSFPCLQLYLFIPFIHYTFPLIFS